MATALRLLGDLTGCGECELFWGSDGNSLYTERVRQAGLYHDIVTAMESFPEHRDVQAWGLHALWWLQFDSADGSLVCMHRKSNAIYPPAERIFQAAERALGLLTDGPDPGRAVKSCANLLTEFFRHVIVDPEDTMSMSLNPRGLYPLTLRIFRTSRHQHRFLALPAATLERALRHGFLPSDALPPMEEILRFLSEAAAVIEKSRPGPGAGPHQQMNLSRQYEEVVHLAWTVCESGGRCEGLAGRVLDEISAEARNLLPSAPHPPL